MNGEGPDRPNVMSVHYEDDWYAERRMRWKPERVRLLLIAESPPASAPGESRRFFYDEDLSPHDSLFREVVKVLFDAGTLRAGRREKAPWLARLKDEGVYVIDAARVPVNTMPRRQRDAALAAGLADTVALARSLEPDGVVVLMRGVFAKLRQPLLDAKLPLLHDTPMPFAGNGHQVHFREQVAAAVSRLPAIKRH